MNPKFRFPVKSIFIFCTISLLCACSSSTGNSSKTNSPSPASTTEPEPTASTPSQSSSPVNKLRNAEGKSYLGAVSRSQQAYRLEYGKFTTNLDDLQLGYESDYFTFEGTEADETKAIFKVVAQAADLKSYAGGTSYINDELNMFLCESNEPSQNITPPTFEGGTWSCGPDSQKIEG